MSVSFRSFLLRLCDLCPLPPGNQPLVVLLSPEISLQYVNRLHSIFLLCIILISFQLISSISLCRYTTVCLSIHHLLKQIWVVSSFGLLQIKLLSTFMYTSLYAPVLPFLLCKYGGMEWLYHMVGIRLTC